MATVVRLKRRRNEDPLEVLFLASKRCKSSIESSGDKSAVDKNVFKFAGTVASKDDGISVQVREAIKKEKLEREYKQHQSRIFGDIRQESRKQSHQKSKQNRLKVTFKHRALELDNLDNIETKTDDTEKKVCPKCGLPISSIEAEDTNKNVTEGSQAYTVKKDENITAHETEIVLDGRTGAISKHIERSGVLKEVKNNIKGEVNEIKTHDRRKLKSESTVNEYPYDRDILTATCECDSRTTAKLSIINKKSTKANDENNSASTDNKQSNVSKTEPLSVSENVSTGDGPVFCLVDMEAENDATTQSMPSSLADQITCNSEPMVREFVSQPTDDDYVYDIYYTNCREFDFRLFERDLTFETFNSDLVVDRAGDDDDFVYGDDNDDENAENNWRNDYPDEDPRVYDTDRSRYNYENDMTEYEAFQTETGDQLADWMSWRCNIDAGEDLSSDDDEVVDYYADKGSSYDAFYKRVKKEMDEDGEDESDNELNFL